MFILMSLQEEFLSEVLNTSTRKKEKNQLLNFDFRQSKIGRRETILVTVKLFRSRIRLDFRMDFRYKKNISGDLDALENVL